MTLKAGKLRHRVRIEKRISAQDPDTGAFVFTWTHLTSVWASVEPLSVREFVASKSEQSEVTARIRIRFRADINSLMRIVHRVKGTDKIYNIFGVLPDPDSGIEYLTLAVGQGVSLG